MLRPTLICLTMLFASVVAQAQTCEGISAQIDAKIRAAGVTTFTLKTVNTEDNAPGKVVGSCDKGSKKIVYLRDDGADEPTGTAAGASKSTGTERILTECKDGTITYGDCKR